MNPPPKHLDLVDRLRSHVNVIAGIIGPRNDRFPEAYKRTRDYIATQLGQLGLAVERQRFVAAEREQFNLQVIIPGRTKKVLVVGAHYDTCGDTPGADDNTSAVAVLIEMARLLKDHPPRPTVRLVAYANEEPPHFGTRRMGSYAHAAALRDEVDDQGLKVHGMLCLEMLGYYLTEPGSQPYPSEVPRALRVVLPSRGNFIGLVSTLRSAWFLHRLRLAMGWRSGRGVLPRVPMWALSVPPSMTGGATMLSDHYQYEAAGFRTAMATDTAFVRNPHYHQRSDLPGTLDYPRMATTTLHLTRGVRRFR